MRLELFNGDDDTCYVALHDRDEAWPVEVIPALNGRFLHAARELRFGHVSVPMLDNQLGTTALSDDAVLAATYHSGRDRVETTGMASGAALRYLLRGRA